jgi:hypothetical protein
MAKSKKPSADNSGTKTNHNPSGDSSISNHQNDSKTELRQNAPAKDHNLEDLNDTNSKNRDDSITRPRGMDA